MIKLGIFNCPKVKRGDLVEFIYNSFEIKDEKYNYRVKGKVIYTNGYNVLIELPQNFKKVGDIKGWIADERTELDYGCCKNKLYWWAETYRKIKKELEIE